MKSRLPALKKNVPARKASLKRVLNKNRKIRKNVKHAGQELTSINEVLNQGLRVNTHVQTIKEAIALNEDVEHEVAGAADDLHQVNIELAREVDERIVIESELADAKTDLADAKTDLDKARDELSISRANEEESRKITFQDALTGLPNRLLLEEHLDQGLSQAKRHGWGLAVLFIDLDEFKSINDSHGHDLGDMVLRMVADRLQSLVRDEDTVSRWGGDEFMCLLPGVKRAADVARLAEKMAKRIGAACELNGIVLSVRASIGIAIYPADGETADILVKNADTAMFRAKRTEKRVMLFRESALGGSETVGPSLDESPPQP
jgi:diguanylate cyclase (GGDEF)-like protein